MNLTEMMIHHRAGFILWNNFHMNRNAMFTVNVYLSPMKSRLESCLCFRLPTILDCSSSSSFDTMIDYAVQMGGSSQEKFTANFTFKVHIRWKNFFPFLQTFRVLKSLFVSKQVKLTQCSYDYVFLDLVCHEINPFEL